MSVEFTEYERRCAEALIGLALDEDLGPNGDVTTRALVEKKRHGAVQVTARQDGILAGVPVAQMVFETLDPEVSWTTNQKDGERLKAGEVVAAVSGPLRSLLAGERTALNFLTHLSGIATLTREYVEAVAGTKARIRDTRKTIPGYRALAKYAVRCGGGSNHRLGLYDGVLVKDNHLAACSRGGPRTLLEVVEHLRNSYGSSYDLEVEVETLDQLRQLFSEPDDKKRLPDIVLLDNMQCRSLREAVTIRDRQAPGVRLEASGGITLENVAEVAATGVDFISVGALTHSAPALDLAFDWQP